MSVYDEIERLSEILDLLKLPSDLLERGEILAVLEPVGGVWRVQRIAYDPNPDPPADVVAIHPRTLADDLADALALRNAAYSHRVDDDPDPDAS